MGDVESWILRGLVSGMIAAAIGVFVRLRKIEAERSAADVRLDHLEKRGDAKPDVEKLRADVQGIGREIGEFKLDVEKRFVTREDWVPVNSRVLGQLEVQGQALARIEENIRVRDK